LRNVVFELIPIILSFWLLHRTLLRLSDSD
jgi:hypothetical protein